MSMRIVKPSSESEKQTRTTMDTVELTQKLIKSWKSPPFQRDLKNNAKVTALACEISRNGGVVPGVLTIGVLDGETYVVDGQHRISAWEQSGADFGYADVRTHWFESMGDMAKEFVTLNSALVRLRPDDILRGMESSTPSLQRIRKKCEFIGYDMIRRSERSPVLSMSLFIRAWIGARLEVPQHVRGADALAGLDENETTNSIVFANVCHDAWRRDQGCIRLWSQLNLLLCAWLFRRMVLGERLVVAARTTKMSADDFRRCLMALAADCHYNDYLVGRHISDRDRAPAYARLKEVFMRRYLADTGKTLRLPAPPWTHT